VGQPLVVLDLTSRAKGSCEASIALSRKGGGPGSARDQVRPRVSTSFTGRITAYRRTWVLAPAGLFDEAVYNGGSLRWG